MKPVTLNVLQKYIKIAIEIVKTKKYTETQGCYKYGKGAYTYNP